MGKIFRLHSGTTNNIDHWQKIPSYIDEKAIDSIMDPSGLHAKNQITSIPSPFARMDLIKSSFNYIVNQKQLDGNTIYHRMVSDTLDIAEIFFNIEAFSDKIEIIEWNSGIFNNGNNLDVSEKSDLYKMINSSNSKHRLLGETLKMFLLQDDKNFNFGSLKHLYLLNYKNGPERLNIIGGTSPTTLFFPSANDLAFVDLSIANDKFFDDVYFPLYKRTPDFIKFLFTLQQAMPSFSEKFKGFHNYLELNLQFLDAKLKEEIRNITTDNANEQYLKLYNDIKVITEGNTAEILGFKLKTKKYDSTPNMDDNDFVIQTTKSINGELPCVLPIDAFNEELNYCGGKWQKDWYQKVPIVDNRKMADRTLPNQPHIKYPYLTISDLLESTIIRVPYPIDSENFFTGNYEISEGHNDHGYILPIKKEFFNYFSLKDLQGVVGDGKKMMEIRQLSGGITVTLRIPIKHNRYVQLKKEYLENKFQDKIHNPDEAKNMGVIAENLFTLACYPFIKMPTGIKGHYRIALTEKDIPNAPLTTKYSIECYSEQQPSISISKHTIQRSNKEKSEKVSSLYSIIEDQFDFIEVSNGYNKGIICPIFKLAEIGSTKFKFSIDFGTTNTHIEYRSDSEPARPFDISVKDQQVCSFHKNSNDTLISLGNPKYGVRAINIITLLEEEFIAELIGNEQQYIFPQRTVINDNGIFDENVNFCLADFNIPFWYLIKDFKLNSTVTSNLKWNDLKNIRYEKRTKAFMEQLVLMIRNKVLLNKGSLAETEFIWFYPTSMQDDKIKTLRKTWKDYFHKYFGQEVKIYELSESLAPFNYYFKNSGVRPFDRPGINIDIGGGTTDVAVYLGKNPILLTSFKFGGNAIFGDCHGSTSETNGFILTFEQYILDIISSYAETITLTEAYKNLKEKSSNSVELIDFFFKLESNHAILVNKIDLSFSDLLLKSDELRIVFLLHFSAIFYHIAQLLKSQNIDVPEFITLSGNGAKLIIVACKGNDLEDMSLLCQLIFKKVYQIENCPSINFTLLKNPKNITCKGGLDCDNLGDLSKIESKISKVLIGKDGTTLNSEVAFKYKNLNDEELIKNIQNEVETFIAIFFNLNNEFSFKSKFGINTSHLDQYKSMITKRIRRDIIDCVNDTLNEEKGNLEENIKETLFFYGLKGSLNELAYQIYKENQKK